MTSYASLYPDLYPPEGPFPGVGVQAQFTPGTWTDISVPYVKSVSISRPVTRLQGPLWQYQAGTCSILLDNSDGRFDPDNLAGPYTSATSRRQVVWVLGAGQSKTWVAPRNLSGTTIQVEAWGPGANGGTVPVTPNMGGTGGGGGEYAAENSFAVIPGNSYAVVCPAGNSGLSTTFAGTGVVAHAASGTTPGTGSTNSIHFDGGPGAAGPSLGSSANVPGGGGGSSAGQLAGGNAGGADGTGGLAPAGGYAGGNGALHILYRGQSGQGPGAGGGGGGITFFRDPGISGSTRYVATLPGFGKGGQVRLTYFVTITPSATVSQVVPMVPVRVTGSWNGVTYPLFSGFADSWTETPVTYSAGYSEVTLAATDGFKVLTGNTLPALGSPLGAGDDSGTRVDRILDWAGWSPTARQIDAGDTTQQATSFGSDALSLLQLTADTEIGECYVNGSGNVVFRHRRAILSDARSAFPQAVFGDQPGMLAPQVQWHGDGVSSNIGINAGPGAARLWPPLTSASKQAWVWSSVAYPAGAALALLFFDSTLANIGTVTGTVVPLTGVPVLISVAGVSPANTAFMTVAIQSQGTPASSVNFFAQAAPPLDSNDVSLTPVLAPWSRQAPSTTYTFLANWSPGGGNPGELACAAIGRANDDTTLANDIQVTVPAYAGDPSPVLQEATDPVSVYVNQSDRSYVRADLLLPDDATAFQYANWVLYISKNSEDRFDTLAVDPLADTQNLYPQVLAREIGDRITVIRTPAGVAARVVKDVFIRGITHSFDAGTQAWLTTWTLQSATRYGGFMTLDSAVSGLLDTDALAY